VLEHDGNEFVSGQFANAELACSYARTWCDVVCSRGIGRGTECESARTIRGVGISVLPLCCYKSEFLLGKLDVERSHIVLFSEM